MQAGGKLCALLLENLTRIQNSASTYVHRLHPHMILHDWIETGRFLYRRRFLFILEKEVRRYTVMKHSTYLRHGIEISTIAKSGLHLNKLVPLHYSFWSLPPLVLSPQSISKAPQDKRLCPPPLTSVSPQWDFWLWEITMAYYLTFVSALPMFEGRNTLDQREVPPDSDVHCQVVSPIAAHGLA